MVAAVEPSDAESQVHQVTDRKKSRCTFLVRTIIFIFCCFLFACQSILLIHLYLSFPTTITTNLTYAEVFDLPAVTLCFKSDIKSSPIEKADEVFKRNFNDKDKEDEVKCNLMIPTINQVTGASDVEPVPCNDIVPIVESINFGLGKKCYTFFSRLGKPVRDGRDIQARLPKRTGGMLTPRNGDLLKLEIEFGKKNEAFSEDSDVSISIHQGNELPTSSQKISKLKPGYQYMVTFNKIIEKRMPPPFKTSCARYDRKDGKSGSKPRSKYDCIDQCLLEMYRETCHCLPADINVRRELLRPTDTFCTNVKCQQLQIHRAEVCHALPQCKPNCLEEMYNFFTEVADSKGTSLVISSYINSQSRGRPMKDSHGHYMPRPMIPNSQFQSYGLQEAGNYHGSLSEQAGDFLNVIGTLSKAFVTVRKSSGPDVIYEHKPQYNSFDFIFQVMTLACVWLGVSVFAVFWKPLYIIFKVISLCFCLASSSRKTNPLISLG